MKKSIPVYMQNEITTYVNYSMPLCVFLQTNKEQWLLEHFSNIYFMIGKEDYVWIDYLEDLLFFKDVLEFTMIEASEMEKIEDIECFFSDMINKDYALMLFIDEFYVSETIYYNKEHKIKQILVHGYDRQKNEIYMLGFDKRNVFTKLVQNYKEVLYSYQICLRNRKEQPYWVDKYNVIILKDLTPEVVYKAKPNIVYSNMKKFFYSEGSTNDLRPEIRIERGEIANYGMQAQDKLINSFINQYAGKDVLDYRYIHLLAEHKKGMLKKIKFFADTKENPMLYSIYERYENIFNQYLILKNVFLKNVFIDNGFQDIYGQLKNKKAIENIYNKLLILSNNEKSILGEFVFRMEDLHV